MVNDLEKEGGAEVMFNTTSKLLSTDFEVKKYSCSDKNRLSISPIDYIYNFKNYHAFHNMLIEFKPDIVHLHNYYHVLSPSILHSISNFKKKNKYVKIVYTAHDFHLCYPNSGYFFFRSKVLNKVNSDSDNYWFRKVDHRGWLFSTLKILQWVIAYKILALNRVIDVVISPSQFLKDELGRVFPKIPLFLVRNPIDLEYKPQRDIFLSNQIRLVYVGRISFEKGILEFIEAMHGYGGNYSFDIIGTGPTEYVERVKMKAASNSNINYLGFKDRNELNALYMSYDALVLPSLWYENFPTVMLEAASMKLRILTCNYGGMLELGILLKNTYFFDIMNKQTVIDAVEKCFNELSVPFIENIDFMATLSENSYKTQISDIYHKLTYEGIR